VKSLSSDKDSRRKRRPWWEDDLFQSQFEAVKRMIEELMERLGDDAPEGFLTSNAEEQFEEILRELQKSPMVWGFSATVGPDGRVQLNPFGNLKTKGVTPKVQEEREPLIEVIEQDESIIIVAEIPGVEEDDINLTISSTSIAIRVDTPRRKYAKTIELPIPIKQETAKTNYANGILEIHLDKE
jgi:HSP20 family protein